MTGALTHAEALRAQAAITIVPASPSPEACREFTQLLRENQALREIAGRTREVGARIETIRLRVEGLRRYQHASLGSLEQIEKDLLQTRIDANYCARALELELDGTNGDAAADAVGAAPAGAD